MRAVRGGEGGRPGVGLWGLGVEYGQPSNAVVRAAAPQARVPPYPAPTLRSHLA